MNLINSLEIKNLPVYTRDNEFVGRVIDFDFDVDTLRIAALHIKLKGFLMFGKNILIPANSVIEISHRGVIISDIVAQKKITNPDLSLAVE